MSLTNIRAALETHLETLTGLPAIAWENVDYAPTLGTPFISVSLQMQRERNAYIGTTTDKKREGLFILSVHTPVDEATTENDNITDDLLSHFSETTSLTSGGTNVRIKYAERKVPVKLPNWYLVNVVVSFYSFD